MAVSLLIGPKNALPHYAHGQHNYAQLIDAQTGVVVARGAGVVHSVTVGVVGTLLKLYDVATGGTTDATTQIANVSLAALTSQPTILNVMFTQGLTAIVTGANAELTIAFDGATGLTNSRTFGVIGAAG